MLTFQDMLIRFAVALLLGGLLGVERELVKKEAGVRTEMLVAGGAALFAMIGVMLPYLTASAIGVLPDASTVNAGLAIIANIVVGIGFLGAGLIIHNSDRVHGATTAALFMALLLFILRKLNVSNHLENELKDERVRPARKRK